MHRKKPMTQQTMMGFMKKKKRTARRQSKHQQSQTWNHHWLQMCSRRLGTWNHQSPMDTNEESPMVMNEESPMVTNVDVQLSSTSTAPIPAETVPTESKSTHPVLSQEQCEASIKECFTEDKVHNYYTCFNQCSKATEQELQRIKPKNLNHDWVEKINN